MNKKLTLFLILLLTTNSYAGMDFAGLTNQPDGYTLRQHYATAKEALDAIKHSIFGNRCSICGQVHPPDDSHFVHIDSRDKYFPIDEKNVFRPFKTVFLEVRKVCLICNDCMKYAEHKTEDSEEHMFFVGEWARVMDEYHRNKARFMAYTKQYGYDRAVRLEMELILGKGDSAQLIPGAGVRAGSYLVTAEEHKAWKER